MNPDTNDQFIVKNQQHDFELRKYSYELTAKLTYFVISLELVICGYMLLNADKLAGLKSISYLFSFIGAGAFFGILWRFFYNESYHDDVHHKNSISKAAPKYAQIICYWLYVAISISSFIWGMIVGFNYLDSFKTPKNSDSKQLSAVSIEHQNYSPPLTAIRPVTQGSSVASSVGKTDAHVTSSE